MDEPPPQPIYTPPPLGVPGATLTPLVGARTVNQHGWRDFSVGLIVFISISLVLFLLNSFPLPGNLIGAGIVLLVMAFVTIFLRRRV